MAKILNRSKTFATNSRLLKKYENRLRIYKIHLRTSGTDNNSAMNPKIYQSMAICGIPDVCGIGA